MRLYNLYVGDSYVGNIYAAFVRTQPNYGGNASFPYVCTEFQDADGVTIAAIWSDGPRWEEVRG